MESNVRYFIGNVEVDKEDIKSCTTSAPKKSKEKEISKPAMHLDEVLNQLFSTPNTRKKDNDLAEKNRGVLKDSIFQDGEYPLKEVSKDRISAILNETEKLSEEEQLKNFKKSFDDVKAINDYNDWHRGIKTADKKETKGVKYNDGKLPLDIMLTRQFPKALNAVCQATMFGHNKYKDTDVDFLNFKKVLGGSQTYADALQRHSVDKSVIDLDSGLPHIFHKCWNALAELELWIEENKFAH